MQSPFFLIQMSPDILARNANYVLQRPLLRLGELYAYSSDLAGWRRTSIEALIPFMDQTSLQPRKSLISDIQHTVDIFKHFHHWLDDDQVLVLQDYELPAQ